MERIRRVRKGFTPQYSLFPTNDAANESLARYQSSNQGDVSFNVECYVGGTRIKVPVLWHLDNETAYKFLKGSKIGFHAYVRKSKLARLQHCHFQNLDPKTDNAMSMKIAKLLEKIPKKEGSKIVQ